MKIYLFTHTFPYGSGETFLEAEVQVFAKLTDDLVIVPRQVLKTKRALPSNVNVDTSFSSSFRLKLFRLAFHFSSRAFRKAVWQESLRFKGNLSFFHLTSTGLFETEKVKEWALKKDFTSHTVFYTYWMAKYTLGLAQFAQGKSNIKVVSRAHGHDLYEFRHTPPALPFRKETLALLNRVYLISKDGFEYLAKRYPQYLDKYTVSKLGVFSGGYLNSDKGNAIHIVSCSRIIPIKRLDLIFKGLRTFCELNPQIQVNWTHIGDGPLKTKLLKQFDSNSINNLRITFLGQQTNSQVLDFYKENHVSCFINTSSSEGIPVSIMEAQSFGIPVIATAVGGTPEIVDDVNGYLLSSDPTPEDIAGKLKELLQPQVQSGKRVESRLTWEKNYNAETNFSDFYFGLKSLFS